MKIAIMQPYFLPYLGYFQLIGAVDKFIIYDDVNFIKQGWINRNRILINGETHFLTLKLKDASSFKKINEISLQPDKEKLLKSVYQAYRRSPNFELGFSLFSKILDFNDLNLANFISNSIRIISQNLNIGTEIIRSSEMNVAIDKKGKDRIVDICRYFVADTYINSIGGTGLYSKTEFEMFGIELFFLKSQLFTYEQFRHPFKEGLSILDILMFNNTSAIKSMLKGYELI